MFFACSTSNGQSAYISSGEVLWYLPWTVWLHLNYQTDNSIIATCRVVSTVNSGVVSPGWTPIGHSGVLPLVTGEPFNFQSDHAKPEILWWICRWVPLTMNPFGYFPEGPTTMWATPSMNDSNLISGFKQCAVGTCWLHLHSNLSSHQWVIAGLP